MERGRWAARYASTLDAMVCGVGVELGGLRILTGQVPVFCGITGFGRNFLSLGKDVPGGVTKSDAESLGLCVLGVGVV